MLNTKMLDWYVFFAELFIFMKTEYRENSQKSAKFLPFWQTLFRSLFLLIEKEKTQKKSILERFG
jgi:hypothetical protein